MSIRIEREPASYERPQTQVSPNKGNETKRIKEVDTTTKINKDDLVAQLAQIDVRSLPQKIVKENQSKEDWRNEPGVWDNRNYGQ